VLLVPTITFRPKWNFFAAQSGKEVPGFPKLAGK
jgi:hypothetical protein